MNAYLRRLAAVAVALTVAKAIVSGPSMVPASIINTTGAAHTAAPPPSVVNDAWQNNKNIRIFHERSGVTLQQNFMVDITAPGTFDQLGQVTPGMLIAGTVVDSYLIHQDGKDSHNRLTLSGSATFSQDILGVIINRRKLDLSDGLFGLLHTAYPTHDNLARGLEFGAGLDWVRISSDRRTISFRLVTSTPMDQIRVLTAMPPVPSPGAAALLAIAACTAGGRRRPRNA